MRPLRVMLGDLTYFNKYRGWMQVVPINIGFIGQYTNQQFGQNVSVSLHKNPLDFLETLKAGKPDVVGLSQYYWNTDLNRMVIKRIRDLYGDDVVIALGGPSTDTEDSEKRHFLGAEYGADALILEEGEVPFTDIVRARMSAGREATFDSPISGAVFLRDAELVPGPAKSVQTDLGQLYSPYLSGLLSKFLHSDYLPLIQMSRYCPYACAFCVSGKTRGKLRGFPIEMIKEEISFISKTFADRPHLALQVADENFGILARDVEIAQHIRECSDQQGFPLQAFYYSDKRFTDTARGVIEKLGKINTMGLQVSLQSGNQKTLQIVSRKNLTEDEVDTAIAWANDKGIETFTELIFGMPAETLESFCETLDRCAKRGFDSIVCYSLFLMAGIPLNTQAMRDAYRIKTKLRLLTSAYGTLDGEFSAEYEEIVVSTSTSSMQDFMDFRKLSFLYFAVFRLGFNRWFFQYIQNFDISLSRFFLAFMSPDPDEEWPAEYLKFVNDFNEEADEELFDTREELIARAKQIFWENGNEVGTPSRLNVFFGSRLIYEEKSWVREVSRRLLAKHVRLDDAGETARIVDLIFDLCERERVSIREPKAVEPLVTDFDVVAWKKDLFKNPLSDYACAPRTVHFHLKPNAESIMANFTREFAHQSDSDFHYNALDFVLPRSNLLYGLSYDNLEFAVSPHMLAQQRSRDIHSLRQECGN